MGANTTCICQTIAAESCAPGELPRTLALLACMGALGAMMGNALASILSEFDNGFFLVCSGACVMYMLCCLLGATCVADRGARESKPDETGPGFLASVMEGMTVPLGVILLFCALDGAFAAAAGATNVIYIKDVYGFDAHGFGILNAIGGLSLIVSNALISPLLAHARTRSVVIIVNFFRVVGTTGFMLQVLGGVTPVCFSISSGIMSLTGPTLAMLIGTNVSPEMRGTMLAVGGAFRTFPCILLTPALGQLYVINPNIPLCVATAFGIVSVFIASLAQVPERAASQAHPTSTLDSVVMDTGLGISLDSAPLSTTIWTLQFQDYEVSRAYQRLRKKSVEAGMPRRMSVQGGQIIKEFSKPLLSEVGRGRRQSVS